MWGPLEEVGNCLIISIGLEVDVSIGLSGTRTSVVWGRLTGVDVSMSLSWVRTSVDWGLERLTIGIGYIGMGVVVGLMD